MPLENANIDPLTPVHPTIQTRGHTTADGILNLSIPVGLPNAEVTVVVHVTPLATSAAVDENGWPRGYFDQVPGSMPSLQRAPQGEYERRLPLG